MARLPLKLPLAGALLLVVVLVALVASPMVRLGGGGLQRLGLRLSAQRDAVVLHRDRTQANGHCAGAAGLCGGAHDGGIGGASHR